MSLTSVGALTAMPIAALSATRARLTAFWARITLTRPLATSTSARVTKDLGWVPTWKKPCALRRLTSARSSAATFTSTSRLESSRV